MKLHNHATLIEYDDTLYKQITNTLEDFQLDLLHLHLWQKRFDSLESSSKKNPG